MLDQGGGIFGFSSMRQYVQGPDISVVVLQNSGSSGARHRHGRGRPEAS